MESKTEGMAREISLDDYYKAIGLIYLHREFSKKCDDVEIALANLLEEEADSPGSTYFGHLSDCLWDKEDIDTMLERLDIFVSKKAAVVYCKECDGPNPEYFIECGACGSPLS